MKIKITYPIRDGETLLQAGLVYDVDSTKAKGWLAQDWCIEVKEIEPEEKVKREPKPKQI